MNEDIIETDFDECHIFSKNIPKEEWNKIIKRCYGEETKIQWKDDKVSQLDFGTDVLITTKKGRKYSVDVKTRNEKYFEYSDWLFEIVHHRYTNKDKTQLINTTPGWLYKSTADHILFSTISDDKLIESVCFSLIPFKNEDFIGIAILKNGWASTNFKNGTYQVTMCKRVPLYFIEENANYFWYWKKVK